MEDSPPDSARRSCWAQEHHPPAARAWSPSKEPHRRAGRPLRSPSRRAARLVEPSASAAWSLRIRGLLAQATPPRKPAPRAPTRHVHQPTGPQRGTPWAPLPRRPRGVGTSRQESFRPAEPSSLAGRCSRALSDSARAGRIQRYPWASKYMRAGSGTRGREAFVSGGLIPGSPVRNAQRPGVRGARYCMGSTGGARVLARSIRRSQCT